MDLDGFKKTFEDRAKEEVTLRLALEKIAQLENVEVTDEEVDNYIKDIADANKVNPEMVKQFIGVENIKDDLMVEKASKIVLDSAVAQEPTEVPAE